MHHLVIYCDTTASDVMHHGAECAVSQVDEDYANEYLENLREEAEGKMSAHADRAETVRRASWTRRDRFNSLPR